MGAIKQLMFEIVKSECSGCGETYEMDRVMTNECYDLDAKEFTHEPPNCKNCEEDMEFLRQMAKND